MTTWTDWENPTLEEIAACIPYHQREILGQSFGSTGPGTITKITTTLDSDGLFTPVFIRAYAFRVDWVSPNPFSGGHKSRTVIAIIEEGGRGTDTPYVNHDIYAVPAALDEAEAQAMISLIRHRLPVHVAGGVEEF